jgi:hypothetical protein
VLERIWLPPRDSNPDMLIQRQENFDFSVIPRGLPRLIESYVGSFLCCDLSEHTLRNFLTVHSPEQAET